MAEAPLWRAFEANEVTHSAAHYLLAIAGLERRAPPRAADVARYLGVSRAAASLQLRSLQEHGLVATGEHGQTVRVADGRQPGQKPIDRRRSVGIRHVRVVAFCGAWPSRQRPVNLCRTVRPRPRRFGLGRAGVRASSLA